MAFSAGSSSWLIYLFHAAKTSWVGLVTGSVLTALRELALLKTGPRWSKATRAIWVGFLIVAPSVALAFSYEDLYQQYQTLTEQYRAQKGRAEAADLKMGQMADELKSLQKQVRVAKKRERKAEARSSDLARQADLSLAALQTANLNATAVQLATQNPIHVPQSLVGRPEQPQRSITAIEDSTSTTRTESDQPDDMGYFPLCEATACNAGMTLLDLDSEPTPACPTLTAVAVKPQIVRKMEPRYTQEAAQRHLSGQIKACIRVSRDGTVTFVKLMNSLGYGLDEETAKAIAGMSLNPARDAAGQMIEWNGLVTATFSPEK